MFERWAGPEVWQKGVHAYLEAHRFGNATADDFLDAENAATGKDVKTAFHTFLDQPGVPLSSRPAWSAPPAPASRGVHLKQSRFLPLGSTGERDQVWQIPVCVRADRGVACTLLTAPEGERLSSCARARPARRSCFRTPTRVGYYRFSLAPKDLASLRTKGLQALTEREKVAYATSLRAAYQRGTTPIKDILDGGAPAGAGHRAGRRRGARWRTSPRRATGSTSDPVRPDVERYARTLYAPAEREARLAAEEGGDRRDPARSARRCCASWRRRGATRRSAPRPRSAGLRTWGRRPTGRSTPTRSTPNLAGIAVGVLGEEADRATWDAMKGLFVKTVNEAVRARLLSAISSVKDPDLAAAARELVLDPALRDNEIITPLFAQLTSNETRETAWAWMKEHYDAIVARLPKHSGLIGTGRVFCDDAHAAEIESFFGPKAAGIEGGPRQLASTLEEVRLCVARRKAYEASAKTLFSVKH